MSTKRDKLIEEAQRMTARGQLDKAVKAYEQLLTIDPSAINQRQKLAELLVKMGRAEDAREQFFTIGNGYASNGFYLKAIAVFKKLQVMFPADITITLKLAVLNQKHGLTANALAEYKQVYDHYEKIGDSGEALNILEKMQDVDSQNVGIKLKLAEGYFKAGKKDLSYAVFGRLASLLQEKGDNAAFSRVNARIQQLFPERSDFMIEVLAEQVAGGRAASALNALQSLLRSNPQDKRVWNLILTAYRKTGQQQRLKAAYQLFLKFFPDDPAAQAGMAECLAVDKDVNGAMACLDACWQCNVERQSAEAMVQVYRSLERLEPVNVRILQGLQRALHISGDKAGAAELENRLAALQGLASGAGASVSPKEPEELPPGMAPEDVAQVAEEGAAQWEDLQVTPLDSSGFEAGDDEIEIEIEVDEAGFDDLGAIEPAAAVAEEDWLKSVMTVFDAITAAPRSVKFGSDLETSDAQSHYDLGVAFKEMGLFDEALNEFRQAATDPERKVECLALQGACLRDKGDVVTAETVLRSLLNPGLAIRDLCAVKYELALTCAVVGKHEEATALLGEIQQVSPGFRDVRSRLDAAGVEDGSLDFSDEDLEGFDLK